MRIGLGLLLLATAASCTMVHAPGKSPLAPPQMSPDSVALDIFFVRFPFGREDANGPLWQVVDEQHFSAESRRQLTKSGFRVGVITGQIPTALSQLLELTDAPPPSGDGAQEVSLAAMQSAPRAVRRHLQCRAAQRMEVLASEVYDELPVLISEPGGLCGQTYAKAQGVLALKTHPQSDGRVRIDLSPELHYGDPKQRFVGDQGTMRLEAGRSRRVFEELALSATLAPGDILILGSLTHRPGSLGHHFFTTVEGGQREQKLVLVRLAQTQHDGLFGPQSVLPLDDHDREPPVPEVNPKAAERPSRSRPRKTGS